MTSPDAGSGPALARAAYRTLEPLHAQVYFVPEAAEAYARRGVVGGRRQYAASRSAPLGRVAGPVVTALFYGFAPATVEKYVPAVWDAVAPEELVAARYEAVSAAYARVLGAPALDDPAWAEAAGLLRELCDGLPTAGRGLAAAYAALPWPDAPHLAVFHGVTLLREWRGDAHVAALVVAGLDPVESLVSYLPGGTGLPRQVVQVTRGWSDEEWAAAEQRLRDRGLLDADGGWTPAGRAQREQVEAQTDAASAAPYARLGAERVARLRDLLRPASRAVSTAVWGSPGR